MLDFSRNILISRWPEILGLLLTLTSGFLVPWISRKSGNYKRLNKQLVLYSLLHLLYLGAVPLLISTIGIVIIVFVSVIAEITMGIVIYAVLYSILAAISLLAFLGVMRISKRMRVLMQRAREVGRRQYIMLWCVSIISIVLAYVTLVFVGSAYEEYVNQVAMVISWVLQIWWICIVASIVRKASDYVYSKIKITMMDGEVLYFDCSPRVCRVYRNYIRILKRDENDVVIRELQINEIAIKQVEYEK